MKVRLRLQPLPAAPIPHHDRTSLATSPDASAPIPATGAAGAAPAPALPRTRQLSEIPVYRPDRQRQRAAEGLRGPGRQLPFLETLQRSFGDHELGGVKTFVGGQAASAARDIGADAYATDGSVAFSRQPDLYTAAHEAAHVVQQRGGVHLSGGVSRSGDRYERHANRVAEQVVRGHSAAPLLDAVAPATTQQPMRTVVQKIGPSYLPDTDGPNAFMNQNPASVGNVSFQNVADDFYDNLVQAGASQNVNQLPLIGNIDIYQNDDPNDNQELARTGDVEPSIGEIDHIFPQSLGGGSSFINAQLVAAPTNRGKANAYPDPIAGFSGTRCYLGTGKWNMPAGTILNTDTNTNGVQLDPDTAKIPTGNAWGGTFYVDNDDNQATQNPSPNKRIDVKTTYTDNGQEVWLDLADAQHQGMAPNYDLQA